MTVPVVTRTEFALTPLSEEDNETDAAVRSWEGVYHSVAEFFEARRDQDMSMPAVSAAHTILLACKLSCCIYICGFISVVIVRTVCVKCHYTQLSQGMHALRRH